MCYMQDNYHCNICIIYVRSVETVTHYALEIDFEFVVLLQSTVIVLSVVIAFQ